jgi:hypothetical protein
MMREEGVPKGYTILVFVGREIDVSCIEGDNGRIFGVWDKKRQDYVRAHDEVETGMICILHYIIWFIGLALDFKDQEGALVVWGND